MADHVHLHYVTRPDPPAEPPRLLPSKRRDWALTRWYQLTSPLGPLGRHHLGNVEALRLVTTTGVGQ